MWLSGERGEYRGQLTVILPLLAKVMTLELWLVKRSINYLHNTAASSNAVVNYFNMTIYGTYSVMSGNIL